MIQENQALVIIEEGTDIEMEVDSLLCCFAAFMFLHN